MRLLAASLLLLCALSASAANRQETIRLRYFQAAELDRILLSPSRPAAGDAKPLAPGSPAQNGSLAWTVDATHNALVVSGSHEAIAEIKALVRMLDVKPPQLSVKIEVWEKTDALLKGLGVDPVADPRTSHPARADYRLELAALAAQGKTHILDSTGLNGTPGQTMRFVWTSKMGEATHYVSTMPRIDGNGTLSLSVAAARNSAVGMLTIAEKTFHHLSSGETSITVLPTGQVLLITPTILPEASLQP